MTKKTDKKHATSLLLDEEMSQRLYLAHICRKINHPNELMTETIVRALKMCYGYEEQEDFTDKT